MPVQYLTALTATVRTHRANLHLGVALAFVAGALNAGGFLAIGQYTSHMTGVISSAADDLVLGKVAHAGPLRLTAPMPGKIVKVLVGLGESVEAGRGILVMEAMKMENELKAARAGTVQEIRVKEGQAVETGALLLVIG